MAQHKVFLKSLEVLMVLITLLLMDIFTASTDRFLEFPIRLLLALLTLTDFLTGATDFSMVIHRARPMGQDSRR